MIKSILSILVFVCVIGWSFAVMDYAEGAVITFDGFIIGQSETIPQDYGDNLLSHIDLSYDALLYLDNYYDDSVDERLRFWHTNYSDLSNVAYAYPQFSTGQITFTPDPGYGVVLNSFDLGACVDQQNQPLRIIDENDTVLWEISGGAFVSGVTHGHFVPNITHVGSIQLQFGNNWNVGIDNISFDQVQASAPFVNPEPGSMLLVGLGLVIGVFGLKKYRK